LRNVGPLRQFEKWFYKIEEIAVVL